MISALINGLLNLISILINFILTPINLLIGNLFPDLTTAIGYFNNYVNTIFTSNLGYFGSLFPPMFKSVFSLWLLFMISYYSFVYTYLGIVRLFQVIRKIKFW